MAASSIFAKPPAASSEAPTLPELTPGLMPAWVVHTPRAQASKPATATPPAANRLAAPPPRATPPNLDLAPTPPPRGALRSSVDGVAWPAFPPDQHLLQLALQFQLEQTQWWSPQRIREHQFHQLGFLLRHAGATVPFYRDLFDRIGFDPKQPVQPDDWQRLPVLERRDLQESFEALKSTAVPPSHGETFVLSSSGSIGMAIKTMKTRVQQVLWLATSLRDHLWHRRDLSGRLASIRIPNELDEALYPDGATYWSWAEFTSMYWTGKGHLLNLKTKVHQQAEWIGRVAPDYLQSLPSNFEALAHHCLDHGINFPSIKELRSVSEVLRPEVRDICRKAFGLEIKDIYSAEEVGIIALQSPASEQLLVQAESIMVEILDDRNRPCAPGEAGRIVVTPLHAFAMPLIRYAIGDLGEVGGAAACGRGLPVINRVLGRVRNMVRLPNGHMHFPSYLYLIEGFDKVIQFQIVRKALERLEMRLVARSRLDEAEEKELTARVQERFQYPFQVSFAYVDEIPRTRRGKYMDYLSEID